MAIPKLSPFAVAMGIAPRSSMTGTIEIKKVIRILPVRLLHICMVYSSEAISLAWALCILNEIKKHQIE
jgi:hypothetical protein